MTDGPLGKSRSGSSGLRLLPWALPASLAAFVTVRCAVLAGKRLFYGNEFLTWYPVTAPFRSMLSSTIDAINASPPLYFVLERFWAHTFGSSGVSLRLFSSLAIVAAVFTMFLVLKRVYGPLAASAAVTLAFMEPELLAQSISARFYPLMEIPIGAHSRIHL